MEKALRGREQVHGIEKVSRGAASSEIPRGVLAGCNGLLDDG